MYRRQTAAYFTAVGLLLLLRRCFILDRMINHCGPIILCFLSLLSLSVGWRVTFPLRSGYRLARFAPRHSFDPSKSWDVKLCFNGEEKTVNVHEDQVLLEAAESVFIDPPFGCRQGVCYACTAQVINGKENIIQDPNLLGTNALDRGIICSCQAHVVGPDVIVQLGAYDPNVSFDD